MFFQQINGKTNYAPPSFFPPSEMAVAEARKIKEIDNKWKQIVTKCEVHKSKLASCGSEEECGAASIALQRCTGIRPVTAHALSLLLFLLLLLLLLLLVLLFVLHYVCRATPIYIVYLYSVVLCCAVLYYAGAALV